MNGIFKWILSRNWTENVMPNGGYKRWLAMKKRGRRKLL